MMFVNKENPSLMWRKGKVKIRKTGDDDTVILGTEMRWTGLTEKIPKNMRDRVVS